MCGINWGRRDNRIIGDIIYAGLPMEFPLSSVFAGCDVFFETNEMPMACRASPHIIRQLKFCDSWSGKSASRARFGAMSGQATQHWHARRFNIFLMSCISEKLVNPLLPMVEAEVPGRDIADAEHCVASK